MAFQRATLPAVLSWADKLVMIGKLLEHIPNSLPMLHLLYHLYGRTIVVFFALIVHLFYFIDISDHIRDSVNALCCTNNILYKIGRVCYNPLCFCLKREHGQSHRQA